ncbi:MAG: NlpC/P60 family protein [Actinomycetota bacterium]|nr:NlpC/P60 family protein [Actinomycetota bacterium]
MNLKACSAAALAATFFTLILGLCAIGAGTAAPIMASGTRPSIGPAVSSAASGAGAPTADDRARAAAAGSRGLPSNYAIPSSASNAEASVIAYSISQLDKPYVFGTAGPDAFDCSGLTMAAWAQAGVRLLHSTLDQVTAGTPRTPQSIGPADLVLVPGDGGSLAAPEHVGLYVGSGLVINAADEAIGIRVQSFDSFVQIGHGLSAIRHIA